MTVVAVWSPHDALGLARSLLQTGRHSSEGHQSALVAERSLQGSTALVGQAPTQSKISLSEDGLVLERGPAWSAPIYYRTGTNACIASSNLSPLVRPEDRTDAGRLAALIAHVEQRDESRTVYRDIQLVRPFETVVLANGRGASTLRSPPRLPEIRGRTTDELATELRERLFAAVARAAGTRRVGLMLSGGLDSSSILAALMTSRGAHRDEIALVTLDFDAPGSDRPHVRALEEHYGVAVTRMRPTEVELQSTLVMDRAPSRHPGDMWLVAGIRRAHAAGAEVVMTGTGGDMLFGGDLHAAVRDALGDRDLAAIAEVMGAVFPFDVRLRARARLMMSATLRPHVPAFLRRFRASKALKKMPEWVGPVLRDEITRAAHERVAHRISRTPQERYEDVLHSPIDSEYGAEPRAQTESVMPIPRADPIYDEELVAFLSAVKQSALFSGVAHRGLLRRAMAGYLPDSVRFRKDKSDFEPAMADSVWPIERFGALLSFEALERAGIVQASGFREYLAPLYRDPRHENTGAIWMFFWPALATEAFLRSTS